MYCNCLHAFITWECRSSSVWLQSVHQHIFINIFWTFYLACPVAEITGGSLYIDIYVRQFHDVQLNWWLSFVLRCQKLLKSVECVSKSISCITCCASCAKGNSILKMAVAFCLRMLNRKLRFSGVKYFKVTISPIWPTSCSCWNYLTFIPLTFWQVTISFETSVSSLDVK